MKGKKVKILKLKNPKNKEVLFFDIFSLILNLQRCKSVNTILFIKLN